VKSTVSLVVLVVASLVPGAVAADPDRRPAGEHAPRERGFAEAFGGYGFQHGTTPYVPTGDGTTFRHPRTHGFNVGAIAGAKIARGLFAVANYEFVHAKSRSGQIAGVVDDIDGRISYHTITFGLRLERLIGPGRVFGQLTLGVLLPFETRLTFEYGRALAALPDPITGEGRRVTEYGFGLGGAALMGYQLMLTDRLYLAPAVKLSTFTTNNDGERIRLDNFVTDFEAPAATTTVIRHDTDATRGAPPTTYSVQDTRVQVSFGARF
jgi:hypothetical protein